MSLLNSEQPTTHHCFRGIITCKNCQMALMNLTIITWLHECHAQQILMVHHSQWYAYSNFDFLLLKFSNLYCNCSLESQEPIYLLLGHKKLHCKNYAPPVCEFHTLLTVLDLLVSDSFLTYKSPLLIIIGTVTLISSPPAFGSLEWEFSFTEN